MWQPALHRHVDSSDGFEEHQGALLVGDAAK
jgi:hypothetical protein